ncbi:hypothetical protein [Actinomycetospora atypica]|uniref:Uncharacterized protein n=1 Tax=Actinomycetospora atypica TaxID=1290095 RepID=A0ABV9YK99_9PSEU
MGNFFELCAPPRHRHHHHRSCCCHECKPPQSCHQPKDCKPKHCCDD